MGGGRRGKQSSEFDLGHAKLEMTYKTLKQRIWMDRIYICRVKGGLSSEDIILSKIFWKAGETQSCKGGRMELPQDFILVYRYQCARGGLSSPSSCSLCCLAPKCFWFSPSLTHSPGLASPSFILFLYISSKVLWGKYTLVF